MKTKAKLCAIICLLLLVLSSQIGYSKEVNLMSAHWLSIEDVSADTESAPLLQGGRPLPDDPYEVKLKSRVFTPQAGNIEQALRNRGAMLSAQSYDRIHVLLQLYDAPQHDQLDFLAEQDIVLLSYIPRNAWLASVSIDKIASDLLQDQLGSVVRWMGEIDVEDKLDYRVQTGKFGSWAMNEDGTVNLQIVFFEDVPGATAVGLLQNHDAVIKSGPGMLNDWVVALDVQIIPNLAAEDSVQWIEQIPLPDVGFNDGARASTNVDDVQVAPYNLSGANVRVGEWDGGEIDQHTDLQGRVTIVEAGGVDNHATHVAGTLAGDGSRSQANGGTDKQWRGMAPSAHLFSYTYLHNDNEPEEHEGAINDNDKGIHLSQNSWGVQPSTAAGCNVYGDYTLRASKYDHVVRGQYTRTIPIVFAAGNERGTATCPETYGSITPPGGTPKNTITVGAVNSDDNAMTTFSSWGPVDDGRLKPEVVAPGCERGAIRNDNVYTRTIWSTFPGDTYGGMCGTSMAAPVVSGIGALLIEQYRDTYNGADPWPSTIKALLVHSARDLNDATAWYNPGPDYASGYGLVDAKGAADLIRGLNLRQDTISADDETDFFYIWVPAGTASLKVTLAWDDVPGALNADPALVNDLDLVLWEPNLTSHYAWILDEDNPADDATTGWDGINNLEQVFVENPTSGKWTIRVNGWDVQQAPQNYSLVSEAFFDILRPNNTHPAYAGPRNNPNKIIVRTTKPANGLTKNDFAVTIGSRSATILTAYEGSEEYVLEVNPPAQTANALYNLTVSVGSGSVSDTETNAVQYAGASNVDAALVIDRSGSMGSYGYMEPAKDAAKQFVDFMHDNDKIGVVSFSSSATVDYGLTTITPASGGGPAFSDDMESGTSKWTADSPWARITSDSHSATHSWTDSPGGNYSNNADVSLTSIAFSLASITNPSLSFWTHYAIESYYDKGYVEISTNGGASWMTLTYYDGTQTSWVNKQVSLAAYAGQSSVRIRFRLYTDYSVIKDGWYIDDVEVIPGSTREEAKSAIDTISSGGTTSIGDGLQDGQSELTSKGEATHPWAMVLLSDGYENTAPYVADVLPAIKSTKTVIHSIALGSNSDEALLMDIASQTGGTYSMAPTAGQLAGVYNTIAGAVSGQQTLFSETGIAQQGVTDVKSVVVDSTVSEATFSVSWSNSASDIDLTLQKPNGSIVNPTVAASDPNIDYVSGSTYEYYRVQSPTLVAGVWKMRITGGSISASGKGIIATAGGEPYTAMVTGQSGLTIHSYLDKSSYLTTEPIKVSATLADTQPIQGATVTVNVQPPSAAAVQIRASEWIEVNGDTVPDPERVAEIKASTVTAASTMTLYDDGAHGDGQANDGVYANTLSGSSTRDAGTYAFTVSASGTSNTGQAFTRQSQNSVYVAVNPNPAGGGVYLPIILKNH